MINDSNNIFKLVVKILTKNNINYWVCHGTLLGIIRENELLSWDHDIDFAVWDDEYSKKDIIQIFSSEGRFNQEFVLEEMNSLHFTINDYKHKRLDINFYSRDSSKAYIKWLILSNSTISKIYNFFINLITTDISLRQIMRSSNGIIMELIKLFIALPFLLIRFFLPKIIIKLLSKKLSKKYDSTGYSYPIELMKHKKIKFLDIDINVPIESEKVLKYTYGEDWRLPKKNYIWHKDAKNLLHLD